MVVNWINSKIGTNLQEEQLRDIKNFSLLWNMLEGKQFDTHFTIEKADALIRMLGLNISLFEEQLTYFRNRYTEVGHISDRFSHLNFRPNDREGMVSDVLLGNIVDPDETILALLIIVYRYRNNLFHGIKNMATIEEQNDNFACANSFLITLMDQVPMW